MKSYPLRPSPKLPLVYLYRDAVDFRNSYRGLSLIVEHEFGDKPFSGTLYVFSNRNHSRIKILFWERSGFEGRYFQSDGYPGYDAVCVSKQIVHLGCWDRARRKFVDAIKAMPKNNKGTKPSKAQVGLAKIDALYRIEREADQNGFDDQQRYEYRQAHSLPKLAELKVWLIENAPKTDKDSLTCKAMYYTINQWDKLERYYEHGSLRMSNVLAVTGYASRGFERPYEIAH